MKSITKIPFHLIFILLLSQIPTAIAADANTDKAALLTLHSILRGRWNLTGTNHCMWQGVVCNSNNRVFQLHLPGLAFVGPIPTGIIGNLTALNFLSLRFNSITGTLPADLANCVYLQYVYLQRNRLSGEIPLVVFQLRNLLRLNLAGNNLSGEIPARFNNLTKLDSLYLERNRLSGEIPDLKLVNLTQFNVSYNLLNGTIPSQLCSFSSSSFEGNSLSPCPEILSPSPSAGPGPGPGSSNGGEGKEKEANKNKLSDGAIAGIAVACVLALLALLLFLFLCYRRRGRKSEPLVPRSIDTVAAASTAEAKQPDVAMAAVAAPVRKSRSSSKEAGAGPGPGKDEMKLMFVGRVGRNYDLEELLRGSAEVLGKGNYGTTYKASLDDGVSVVVKRLKDASATEDVFKAKMEEIGRLEHENLVALRAYHSSSNEKLLVYDYFPLGSLSALLHGNQGNGSTPLNWETRSTIALGAARGILYIHSQSPTFSHGNIKSSNILLSNSYEARVSDIGLSQIASPTASPNRVAGYRAPEVTDTRKISQKADIYSFGIFLLELLTGKAPTHGILNEEGVDLPRWVQSVVRDELSTEVFDTELLRYQNVDEDMLKLLQLGLDCTAQYPDSRPSMTQITTRIEEICRSVTSKPSPDLLADITSNAKNKPFKNQN